MVFLQQLLGLFEVGSRRGRAAQGLVGGFLHGHASDQTDHGDDHQVIRRHVQIVGAFHQPGHGSRGQTGDQHRDVEGTGQRAVADVRGEHRRQGRGHHADEEVEQHREDQQAGEDQADAATVDQHECRNGEDEQANAADDDEGFAADLVADETDQRLHEEHADHDRDDDQHTVVFAVVQVVRQVTRHVGEQHVIGDVGRRHYADAGHQAAPVFGCDFLERHLRATGEAFAVALFEFFHVLLERRCFFEGVAQIQADHAQRQGEEERNPPAPFFEALFTKNRRDQHHHARAEDETGDRAEIQPTAEEAALTVGRVFSDEDRGAGVFATDRETLGHFRQQQQDRRPDADRGIGRNQADGEGAQGHDDDGRGEDFLPSVLVAQGTEEQTAKRTDEEGHGEGRQRGDHLHAGIGAGEEDLAEHIGDKAVDAKVEPFHGVAQRGGGDRLAHLGVVDNGDVFQTDRFDGVLA